jgi:7,8-dihydro-6-hydroxymethylpterin-pyrophosphokinase
MQQILLALGSNLKFIDANKINLNNLKAAISFKDGMVSVKPLTSIIKISKATIAEKHGFDQSMNNINLMCLLSILEQRLTH